MALGTWCKTRFDSLLFAIFAYVIAKTGGHFDAGLVGVCFLGFVYFCWARFNRIESYFTKKLAVGCAITFCTRLYHRPGVVYSVEGPAFWFISKLLLVTLFCLIISGLLEFRGGKYRTTSNYLKVFSLFSISLVYFLVPHANPNPFIDVFRTNNLAVDYLVRGMNPYAQTYPDIYNGVYDYKPAVAYFPGFFYFFVPFKLLTGDIRFALVVGVLFTAVFLYKIARHLSRDREISLWISLCWLCFPTGLFIVEEGFLDPLLTMVASMLVWKMLRQQWITVGILVGIILALKQYGVLILPVLVGWFFFKRQYSELVKVLGLGLLVFILLCSPFVIWGPEEFYFSTVRQIVTQQPRLDSFSIVAFLGRNIAISKIGKLVVVLSLSIFFVVGLMFSRIKELTVVDFVSALAVVHGWVFFWGKQAFANYYYYFFLFFFVFLIFGIRGQSEVECTV